MNEKIYYSKIMCHSHYGEETQCCRKLEKAKVLEDALNKYLKSIRHPHDAHFPVKGVSDEEVKERCPECFARKALSEWEKLK